MKQELIRIVNKLVSDANQLLIKSINNHTRKELSEIYLSLAMLHDNFELEPISKTSLEYLMNKIVHEICSEDFYSYYMGFYYLPNNVYDKKADDFSRNIYHSNININCFRCLIHASDMLSFSLETSANEYFFSRGSRICSAIKNYISYPFEFDISSMVYLTLNYYQTLNTYNNCSDVTYKHFVSELKAEFEELFELILSNDDFSRAIKSNQQLLAFWCSTVPNNNELDFVLSHIPEKINIRFLWVLYSYFCIDTSAAQNVFENTYDKIILFQSEDATGLALLLRLFCLTLLNSKNTDISNVELLQIQVDQVAGVRYPLGHFFKNYNNINQQNCTAQELEQLITFDDSELRKKVAACMQNIDQNELERQITKPHGALEISDLDVKFTENGNLKYLCMPFKTGREITKATMDESYMYQLLKPFSHFGAQCMVVLVTAKKCSQGLETYIQRMSIKVPSWRIEVIQNEQLCKLLKANSQI